MTKLAGPQEFLVVGLGRFGSSLSLRLTELGHSVLAVDSDLKVVQGLADELPRAVSLDATDEHALRELGVEYFENAVVAIGDDFESSVLVTASLKELGIKWVACKALNTRQQKILLKAGADQVLLPEHDAGVRLADDLAARAGTRASLELTPGCSLRELDCPPQLIGRVLHTLDLRGKLGLTLVAIRGYRALVLPGGNEVLQAGDVLVLAGAEGDLLRLESWQP